MVSLFEDDEVQKVDDGKFKPITKNGYQMDEVVSALQKEIRRSNVKDAMYWALELFDSGYHKYVFKRLCTIATEDVGNSNTSLVNSVFLIYQYVCKVKEEKHVPDVCMLGYVVLGLCDSEKNRESDDLANEVMRMRRAMKEKNILLKMPDYAIDKHTKRGKEMGKTFKDFWTEGCKLEGEKVKKSRFVPYVEGEGDGSNRWQG